MNLQQTIDKFLDVAAIEIAGWDCFPTSASLVLQDADGERVELDHADIRLIVRLMETTDA